MPTSYYVDAALALQLSPDRFWSALAATAQAIAPMCQCFEAEVVCAKNSLGDTGRSGFLPDDSLRRELLVEQLVDWLQASAERTEVTLLLCTDCGRGGQEPTVKFRYSEQPDRWMLLLSHSEFGHVQRALAAAGISRRLFARREEPGAAYQLATA